MPASRSSLGQSSGQQAVSAEGSVGPLCAVHVECGLRLVGQVHQCRYAGLHAKRQFVLTNPSRDFRIGGHLLALAVQFRDDVDHFSLVSVGYSRGVTHVEHGIASRIEVNALKLTGKKTAVPLPRGDRLALTTAG